MERLDKILATTCGLSRKEAKAAIKHGEVFINGAAAKNPEQKCSGADKITLCGKEVDSDKFVYYMMNKPSGVLSATRDKNCETVLDLLPQELRRKGLFPAGRLDKDTEGFLLITDDGGFAHKILSPKNHVPKKYYAVVDGNISADICEAFEKGLELGSDICSPAQLVVIKNGEESEAEVTIYEGMYHQVKRMFAKFSLEVKYLKRLKIGGLGLDPNLPVGGVRKILHNELEQIV